MPTVGTVLYDSTVPSLRGALGRASSGAAASRLIRIAKSSVLYEVWRALTEREGQVGRLPRYLFVSCLVSLMCGKLSSQTNRGVLAAKRNGLGRIATVV